MRPQQRISVSTRTYSSRELFERTECGPVQAAEHRDWCVGNTSADSVCRSAHANTTCDISTTCSMKWRRPLLNRLLHRVLWERVDGHTTQAKRMPHQADLSSHSSYKDIACTINLGARPHQICPRHLSSLADCTEGGEATVLWQHQSMP